MHFYLWLWIKQINATHIFYWASCEMNLQGDSQQHRVDMQMRFVSEDTLIISISAQAVIPPNAASPVWAHYLCHKNTISMIITGFIYKPGHKASALKISRGRSKREIYQVLERHKNHQASFCSFYSLKMQEGEQALDYFINDSRLIQGLDWWGAQNYLHSKPFLTETPLLLCHCHCLKVWRNVWVPSCICAWQSSNIHECLSIQVESHSEKRNNSSKWRSLLHIGELQ